MLETLELYMQDILRNFSTWLLLPVLIILIAIAVFAVWCIVSVVMECLMQRRHFRENVPEFVDAIEAAPFDQVQNIIENSQMLVTHKDALLIVAEHMNAKPADLYAIAKREVGLISERYQGIVGRTDMAANAAPMFGLMGTLIPLGPGIVAMGQGNTEVLASSMLVAFDTTVAGLITSVICMAASKLRKNWYQKYLGALEASMTAILVKAESYREAMGIPNGVEKQPMQSVNGQVVLGNLPMQQNPAVAQQVAPVTNPGTTGPQQAVAAVQQQQGAPEAQQWQQAPAAAQQEAAATQQKSAQASQTQQSTATAHPTVPFNQAQTQQGTPAVHQQQQRQQATSAPERPAQATQPNNQAWQDFLHSPTPNYPGSTPGTTGPIPVYPGMGPNASGPIGSMQNMGAPGVYPPPVQEERASRFSFFRRKQGQ